MDTTTAGLLETYRCYQEALGYSTGVLSRDKSEAQQFWRWAESQGDDHPLSITANLVRDYQQYLSLKIDYRHRRLNPATVRLKLDCLKRFYRWLLRQDLIAGNPFDGLDFPRLPCQYKRQPLTEGEIARLFAVPDITTANGIRVRAILETFYSTGLRSLELAKLEPGDVDAAHGWLRVHEGKNKQSRVVPIGESALFWVMRYLLEVRPLFLRGPDTGHLFLSGMGRFYKLHNALSCLVRRYFVKAGIEKPGACHVLRHSTATHMLQHGADIRAIQEMLGHKNLQTTAGYTRLECSDLQKVQQRCHPWP